MQTLTIIVSRKFPIPVLTPALKNFTGAGGVEPAGTSTGYDMPLIGFVHVEFALHATPTLVMCDADVGK
jgi:hypothetical protein